MGSLIMWNGTGIYCGELVLDFTIGQIIDDICYDAFSDAYRLSLFFMLKNASSCMLPSERSRTTKEIHSRVKHRPVIERSKIFIAEIPVKEL